MYEHLKLHVTNPMAFSQNQSGKTLTYPLILYILYGKTSSSPLGMWPIRWPNFVKSFNDLRSNKRISSVQLEQSLKA